MRRRRLVMQQIPRFSSGPELEAYYRTVHPTVDVVFVDTRDHLIDAAALAAMRRTAVLINVARGELVDEPALVAALQAGQLAGAGLDTVAEEPLAADNPLWHLPNVLITPHRASGSDGMLQHYRAFFTENVRRFGEGQPLLGLVDRQAGY